MRLLLCRHAEAVDPDDTMSDEERWLTKHGRQQARDIGEALRKQGFTIDRFFTSSLVRAVQTADLIAEALGTTGAVRVLRPLAPGGRLSAVLDGLVEQATSDETVAIVGHEPQMSEWSAQLLGRPRLDRAFKKGAVLCVKWKELPEIGTGQGVFFITPKALTFDSI